MRSDTAEFIVIESISKSFENTRVISELSLAVSNGEFCVLLGPSGCGKTTLLRIIAGLEPLDQGRIIIGGVDCSTTSPQERNVAMVFQHFALYPHRSVRGNIEYPLRVRRRLSESEIQTRVIQVASYLGIELLLDRKTKELSGGEAQRVALARALVREPVCFLMDEPLSNLDAQLRIHARAEIKRLQRELNVTTIYVTHDQEEAVSLADKIAIINKGRLIQTGTAHEIFRRPATSFVAGFVGKPPMNLLHGEVTAADGLSVEIAFDANKGKTILKFDTEGTPRIGRRVIVGVRPEEIGVDCVQSLNTAGTNEALLVDIEMIEGMTCPYTVYCRTALGQILVRSRTRPELGKATAHLPRSNVHLFDEETGVRLQ